MHILLVCQIFYLTSRKVQKLKLFENRMLRL